MALTDKAIKAAQPKLKAYKIADGGGLHLLVTPAGGKLWRLKYRTAGKERQVALGAYPAVSLAEARDGRDKAKADMRAGRDPSLTRKNGTAPDETFEAVAREWHARTKDGWTDRHAGDVLGSLERLVFPTMGPHRVSGIHVPMVLNVMRKIEGEHGCETARRVRQRVSAVFVSAIASGLAHADPAAVVRGAMAPLVRGRMPAVTTLDAARDVLARVDAIPAHPATKAAHRFLALTLVRPDNVNGARWDEMDIGVAAPVWTLTAARMKTKEPHIVPLTRAAVEVLEAIRPLTGRSPFVFPNARFAHRPMSENAMSFALRRAGLDGIHVPHGWRATFSSVMNEMHPIDSDAIERILAHSPKDRVRAAYNRAQYLDRRRELLDEWVGLLLKGAPSAVELISGPRRPLKAAS
jgi:integrase